ncbi:MAG TPA: hypothetical protein VFU21_24420 [Kofleriaceae bacterium]|nr:hypothetical protein [Kofleriaceae bacterium]
MQARVGVLALTVLLSAACGDIVEVASDAAPAPDAAPELDAAPPDPCEGEPATFQEAVHCMEIAACDFFSRCLAPFEEGQCESNPPFTFFGDDSRFNENAIAEAIEAGRVEYHPEGLADCLAFFRDSSCNELFESSGEFLDRCPILAGTAGDGEDCVVDAECATPHAVCSEDALCSMFDACCVRGCVPPSPPGGECRDNDGTLLCQPGDHCVDYGEPTGTCQNGEDGAPCEQFGNNCDPGFWCEDGSCRPEVESGAPCYDNDMCPGAETCLGNELDGGKIAWVCGRSDREGDRCDGFCRGFFCDMPSPIELGTCVPFLREEGADCSVKGCALPGWVCDPGADQCVPRVGLGEVCSALATQQCQFGLRCSRFITGEDAGTCYLALADGERCEDPDDCASGICFSESDTDPRTCQPYPGCYE